MSIKNSVTCNKCKETIIPFHTINRMRCDCGAIRINKTELIQLKRREKMGKIFKVVVLASLLVFITGCGAWERTKAKYTGYGTVCVEGVEYIQFSSGASVAYNPDGTVKTCQK